MNMQSFPLYDYAMQNRKMWNLKPHHYYGDIVRRLFLVVAFFMLLTLPFFLEKIPLPYYLGIFSILLLIIFSGLTNPKQLWVSVFDGTISLLGVIIFGYYAIDAYLLYSVISLYFWVNQLFALIFLISLYYSIKTIRGNLIADKNL